MLSYKWRIVAMLWCISFFNYADRQAIFSVFPLLEREMHLTPVQLGLLGSGFAWVYGLASPLAGIVVDRARRKTVILGGLHAWSIICLATVVSRNFTHLLLFRAAEGLGETFYFPASTSMLSDYHGSLTRSRALGLHQTAVYMGTIGGGFFAGLIAEAYGWRWSFVVFGGLGVLLGVVLTRFLVEPPRGAADIDGVARAFPASAREHYERATARLAEAPEARRRQARDRGPERAALQSGSPELGFGAFLRLVGRTPTLLCLLGAFMCANFVAVVLLSWMPKFLYDRFHMGLAMSGLTATVFVQLASMAGAPVGGWLADLWRRRSPRGRMAVQTVGVLGGAPFVVLCGMTASVATLVVSLTLWGFFKGLYDANIFASAFDVVPPEARGRTAGFMNMIGWLAGGGSAPIAIGVIAERISLGAALALASLVYVAAAALLIAGMMMVKQGAVSRRALA
jgi:MFS family permease